VQYKNSHDNLSATQFIITTTTTIIIIIIIGSTAADGPWPPSEALRIRPCRGRLSSNS